MQSGPERQRQRQRDRDREREREREFPERERKLAENFISQELYFRFSQNLSDS